MDSKINSSTNSQADSASTATRAEYTLTEKLWRQLWRSARRLERELREEPHELGWQRPQAPIPALRHLSEDSDTKIGTSAQESEPTRPQANTAESAISSLIGAVQKGQGEQGRQEGQNHSQAPRTEVVALTAQVTPTTPNANVVDAAKAVPPVQAPPQTVDPSSTTAAPAALEPDASSQDWPQNILNCQACNLGKEDTRIRQQAIVGYPEQHLQTPRQVELLLVCDAPNYDADCLGLPLPNDCLEYLGKWLDAIQISENYYLTNLVKCRTPGNRAAWPEEIKSCLLHLHQQIAFFQPRAILALGSSAARSLSQQRTDLNTLRGSELYFQAAGRSIPLAVTYSVTEVLHNPNELRALVWQDLKRLHALLQNQG